jgi:hypothetical protein
MTGFIRGALAVTAGLVLLAGSAMAGVPSPANSTVDEVIVGNASGNAMPKGRGFGTTDQGAGYIVTVRDVTGALMDATVTINFSTAAGNTGLIPAVVKANPFDAQTDGSSVDCATRTISKATTGGVAIFNPRFHGAENTASIEVRAAGVLLAVVKARSTAANFNGETELADLGIFQENFSVGGISDQGEESDFSLTCDPNCVDLIDLGYFQSEFATGVSGTPCMPLP